jgi:hypothetical protein
MACEYLSKEGSCAALLNVKISGGVAHFCDADYQNCPRYQFVQLQKEDSTTAKSME